MTIFIKVLIAVMAFGVSLYFGVKASKKYASRELYFAEMVQFCNGLAGEIGFKHALLTEIFEKYSLFFKSLLSAQLKAAGEIVAENDVIDEAALRARLPRGGLKQEEYDNVVLFLNGLGKSDSDNQIGLATGFKTVFEASLEQARADKRKYGPLYWKLGLLGAFAFVIVIV